MRLTEKQIERNRERARVGALEMIAEAVAYGIELSFIKEAAKSLHRGYPVAAISLLHPMIQEAKSKVVYVEV
jgi:hypothetical protein